MVLGSAVSGCLVECDLNGQTFTSRQIPVDSNFTAAVDDFWTNGCFGKRGLGDARDFGTYQIVYDDEAGKEEPDTNRTQELLRQRMKCEWREPPGSGRDYLIHDWNSGPYSAQQTEWNREWCLQQAGDKVVRFVSWDTLGQYRQENWREPWIVPPPCGGYGQPCCGVSCSASLVCMGANNGGGPSPYLCSTIFGGNCRCGNFTPRPNGQNCLTNLDCASAFCRVNTSTHPYGVCSNP
jgi:hypothetical protein